MNKLVPLLSLLVVSCAQPRLKVIPSKTTLLANGYDHMVFKIKGATQEPRIELLGDRLFCHVYARHSAPGRWEAQLDAGVIPGLLQVKISSGSQHISHALRLLPQNTDSASDGTPDFLRLDDDSDRTAFRAWMTYLAEVQYFISPVSRPREIVDCSSLVRFSYREALRDHDAGWMTDIKLPIVIANSSIRKYSFPHTLLGPAIFRTRGGVYSASDLTDGLFAEFADAKTLQQFNTFFVSRDITRAQPGDILFYRRDTAKGIFYHSMIFVGTSQVKPDGQIYVVYHTGPDGSKDGEIRRLTLTQLLHFPNPQWQPITANELFLGVYRWNILKVVL